MNEEAVVLGVSLSLSCDLQLAPLSSSYSRLIQLNPNTQNTNTQQESKARPKIISFCKAVDSMLGGGVHKGQLTEIAGLPGTGKTQIA